ncbi:hypothetical protein C0Q70_01704 [Pomacea canaliculata]|uniref:Uncharacterized protein n=1 Tax=Pomacea canaliculata TaxID=400727 RepID=A0A2T7Q076_POMCA|nr:hypothetical protein C0Q70_01704 [Pomacea canaliculata]
MAKAVHESMSYTIFHARKFTMPKVVVKAHPADSLEGLINSRKQSGRSLASQREESQLWLSLETNPNEKRSHAKGLTNIMKDIKRFIKEEKKDRKVRKSIEAKIETARVAAKNLWDRKTRRSTEMSLDKHKHKDSKALEQQPWKLHEGDDTNIDTVQEANPQAVMLDSKNLVPTHYNILRDDKNPLQLLKVFMERGKQSHLEESSDSSSSSDEAEIVREPEDESGLFVSTSSLPTRKRAARSGFTFRGLQTLREFLKQHGVVVSLKIANIFRELLFSRRPIDRWRQ